VIHRDLKPGNVFLAEGGGVKLLDLGLARVFGAGGPEGAGTPAFMAPEQWRGEADDPRTDVFAAGALLHDMLAGQLPFGEKGAGAGGARAAPLPRSVPGPLRRVVERALALDPAARPRDGRALLDEIVAAERAVGPGRRRRVVLGAAWAGLAAVAIAMGWGLLRESQEPPGPPPPRIRVLVADVSNTSGERNLDALSGLLVTALEPSPRLAVVPRSRLFDLLRQSGREDVARIDAAVARSLAGPAGAQVLVLPAASRGDGAFAVELSALDLTSGEPLLSLREEAPGQEAVPGLVDRLARRVREGLRERESDLASNPVEVGRSVTASLDAYRHYHEGQECLDRPSRGPSWHKLDCAGHFRRALEIDRRFALAHYQLAWLLRSEGSTVERQREALAPALTDLERIPPKERDLVLAWKAHLDGEDGRALALYKKVVDDSPDDKRPVYLAADLLHHRGDLAGSLPYFERVLELDPEFEFAMEHAAEDLGWLGRHDRLRELVRAWERLPPDPATLHVISAAKGWLGDARGALEVARSAFAGGEAAARGDLVRALLYAGDAPGAEALVRQEIARGRAGREQLGYQLALALANQGRWREARAVLDGMEPLLSSSEELAAWHARRAHLLAGFGDAASVLREVERVEILDRRRGGEYATHVAYAGDLASAARLASSLDPAGGPARLAGAVAALRRREAAAAAEALAPLAAPGAVRPWFPEDAPVLLHGEALAEAGRCAQAVEVLRRYQRLYVPTHFWRPWGLARSRLLLARCYERLGRPDAARAELDHLLQAWSRADAGMGVVREARDLRARIGRSKGS
jgi:tetratricopeptide (TPR) repeat protein